jgi:hypothetical protein
MGRYPLQGVLPKRLKGFIASHVNSELEQARGPNPWRVQQQHLHVLEQQKTSVAASVSGLSKDYVTNNFMFCTLLLVLPGNDKMNSS